MHPFEIVAHRSIPTEAPENTIASFQRAVELGADAVELDVRHCSRKSSAFTSHPVIVNHGRSAAPAGE
jgi:hypothetical protein